NNTFLVSNGCSSVHPVDITSCAGSCDTSSIYSMVANSMMHKCSCCQEMRTSSKEVQMNCPDGHQITYTYTYVEECENNAFFVFFCKTKSNNSNN
uniref:CTCK domain-containing protein n=1 Tax=Astyanax mexicanus TaxID=7994 RepID=A0A3B1JYQ9_ASTMX